MLARKRKLRAVVIKGGRPPGVHTMAALTTGREVRSCVIRVGRLLESLHMTASASGGRARVFTRNVARRALYTRVFAGQLESGKRVVKLGRSPGCAAVAALALRREIKCNVVRVARLFEILDVTIAAGIWGPGKSAARMARRATRVLV